MPKLSKARAGYTEYTPTHDHCNLCVHWRYRTGLTGTCEKVAGPILPHATCRLWQLDAGGRPQVNPVPHVLTGHHTEARVFRSYEDALSAARGLGITAKPQRNLAKPGWVVLVEHEGEPYYYRNPRQDPRAARLVFGDVAQWAVAANIAPGDRIAFLNYAGRGRDGPEYTERTGTVHLVGPEGPVVSLPGDRHGASPVVVTQDKFLRVVTRKRNPPEAESGTLADLIRSQHITSTAVEDPSIPDDPEWRGATHWKVRLKMSGRSMTVPFHMGSAHTRPPTTEDVLDALASDSSGYENARGFKDWASEYGYDEDSRKAEATWRQVVQQAKKLKAVLGPAVYEVLLYHTERL